MPWKPYSMEQIRDKFITKCDNIGLRIKTYKSVNVVASTMNHDFGFTLISLNQKSWLLLLNLDDFKYIGTPDDNIKTKYYDGKVHYGSYIEHRFQKNDKGINKAWEWFLTIARDTELYLLHDPSVQDTTPINIEYVESNCYKLDNGYQPSKYHHGHIASISVIGLYEMHNNCLRKFNVDTNAKYEVVNVIEICTVSSGRYIVALDANGNIWMVGNQFNKQLGEYMIIKPNRSFTFNSNDKQFISAAVADYVGVCI